MKLIQKQSILLLSVAILSIATVASATLDMDMSHHHTGVTSNTTELEPVPHEMHGHHGLPILETDLTPAERKYWESYNTTTYFTLDTPFQSYLHVHVGFLVLSLFLLYPASLILNNVESSWFLPTLTLNNIILTISLFSYMIFINNVEDLYPGNCYGKMGVILFFLMLVHYGSAIVKVAGRFLKSNGSPYDALQNAKSSYIPMTEFDPRGPNSPSSTLIDQNGSTSSNSRGNSSDFDLEDDAISLADSTSANRLNNKMASLRDRILFNLCNHSIVTKISSATEKLSYVVFALTNHIILCYLFVHFIVGISVLNILGQGIHVFNLLAHFIKGGVFFCLGVLALLRYLGAFQKAGLAWNYSFIGKYESVQSMYLRLQPNSSMLTMELIESGLILFYGSTNVFLEHLAGAGGAWTAKDLQHISIAFMFIGCGLCGVMTEIKLTSWRRQKFESTLQKIESSTGISKIEREAIRTCTPGFSPNPFPALTIFFTGLLMSQHQQASELSTQVHVQWGSLLTYGSFFRLLTFLLLTFWNFNSYESMFEPVKPFSELFCSFALLGGGLIFMESTDSIIEAMEYRGFTSMFTLNVSVGLVTLFMGWIMVLMAWRDHMRKN